MKNWRTPILIITVFIVFYVLKSIITFPIIDPQTLGVLLTVAGIMFGFLAGFFISELWTRYTAIRQLQALRTSGTLNMIQYASHFFSNKKFEAEFKKSVEASSVVDELINWDEGHFEIPYFRKIGESFELIKLKNKQDELYFDKMFDNYSEVIKSMVEMDVLYKERLFISEWLMLTFLSVIMSISVLFLDIPNTFLQGIIYTFPAIMVLALCIIYDLDTMQWSRDMITLEPSGRILDVIGAKRFYAKKSVRYLAKDFTDYRKEEDLDGELKDMYLALLDSRKKKGHYDV